MNRKGLECFDTLVARLRIHNLKHGFTAATNHKGKRAARHTLSNLMLIVTELSEAAQEVRRQSLPSLDTFSVELADAFLRILDLADAHGIDLIRASEVKMTLNEKRPNRHGGKII